MLFQEPEKIFPKMIPDADLGALESILSSDRIMLIVRMDGNTSIKGLSQLLGMSIETIVEDIRELFLFGVIKVYHSVGSTMQELTDLGGGKQKADGEEGESEQGDEEGEGNSFFDRADTEMIQGVSFADFLKEKGLDNGIDLSILNTPEAEERLRPKPVVLPRPAPRPAPIEPTASVVVAPPVEEPRPSDKDRTAPTARLNLETMSDEDNPMIPQLQEKTIEFPSSGPEPQSHYPQSVSPPDRAPTAENDTTQLGKQVFPGDHYSSFSRGPTTPNEVPPPRSQNRHREDLSMPRGPHRSNPPRATATARPNHAVAQPRQPNPQGRTPAVASPPVARPSIGGLQPKNIRQGAPPARAGASSPPVASQRRVERLGNAGARSIAQYPPSGSGQRMTPPAGAVGGRGPGHTPHPGTHSERFTPSPPQQNPRAKKPAPAPGRPGGVRTIRAEDLSIPKRGEVRTVRAEDLLPGGRPAPLPSGPHPTRNQVPTAGARPRRTPVPPNAGRPVAGHRPPAGKRPQPLQPGQRERLAHTPVPPKKE